MRLPRAAHAAVAAAFLVVAIDARPAFAADAPGSAALRQARTSWDKGDKGSLETAEALYREAIEKGGLAPGEILEGYTRIGAVRAMLGKKDQAVAAFKAAAILDASFAVPAEAGSKGPQLAERAKRDTSRIGSLKVTIDAPKETPAGKPFKVTATIDASHVGIIPKIGLVAKDGTSGKETIIEPKTSAESVEFEVPGEAAMPSASLLVRVDALDKNANRLGSAETRVKVPGDDKGPIASTSSSSSSGGTGETTSSTTSSSTSSSSDTGVRKGGSFWSSPWPYVIGGAALIGIGTAVYFGTRPSDTVTVGPVGVNTK